MAAVRKKVRPIKGKPAKAKSVKGKNAKRKPGKGKPARGKPVKAKLTKSKLSKKHGHGSGPFGSPANAEITGVSCVPDGTGTGATLSFTLTIERTPDESIASIQILVDGAASAISPTQTSETPTGTGTIKHTFSASGSVSCDTTHTVKAVVTIEKTFTVSSNQESVNCPCS